MFMNLNESLQKRLYLGSFILFVLLIGGALLLDKSSDITLGLVFGYALGILPFASWHLVLKVTMNWQVRRTWGITLSIGKWVIILAAIYFVLQKRALNPFAILGGMSAVIGVLLVLALGQTFSPKNPV